MGTASGGSQGTEEARREDGLRGEKKLVDKPEKLYMSEVPLLRMSVVDRKGTTRYTTWCTRKTLPAVSCCPVTRVQEAVLFTYTLRSYVK